VPRSPKKYLKLASSGVNLHAPVFVFTEEHLMHFLMKHWRIVDPSVPLFHPELKLRVRACPAMKAEDAIRSHGWRWGVRTDKDNYVLIPMSRMPNMDNLKGRKRVSVIRARGAALRAAREEEQARAAAEVQARAAAEEEVRAAARAAIVDQARAALYASASEAEQQDKALREARREARRAAAEEQARAAAEEEVEQDRATLLAEPSFWVPPSNGCSPTVFLYKNGISYEVKYESVPAEFQQGAVFHSPLVRMHNSAFKVWVQVCANTATDLMRRGGWYLGSRKEFRKVGVKYLRRKKLL